MTRIRSLAIFIFSLESLIFMYFRFLEHLKTLLASKSSYIVNII